MEKVCLVIGAGAGIGGTVAKRFAKEGYHAYLARRTDEEGLEKLITQISDDGGKASGSLLNVIEENSIEDLVNKIESKIGPIDTVIYNIGAQIGDRSLAETSYKAFEMGWRMATFGLFRLAQVVTPKMKERQGGNIIVTSATSAVRGNKGQHSHAAAMGGRRMLCQSLNAEFAKDGIHVAHVIIDGAVDAPDTLGKMLGPDLFQKFKEQKGDDGMILPENVADTYLFLAQQTKSTWTHEIDIRAVSDQAWWNHFILSLSTYLVGMHHEKLDVVVFVIDLEIIEGQDSNARDFVSRITNNVKDKEPRTLVYQYHFSKKENKVFLLEIYPNNEAALIHMNNFLGSKWETEFVQNFTIKNFQVLGNANSELEKSLEPFTKDFRNNLIGFDRVAEQLGQEISKIK